MFSSICFVSVTNLFFLSPLLYNISLSIYLSLSISPFSFIFCSLSSFVVSRPLHSSLLFYYAPSIVYSLFFPLPSIDLSNTEGSCFVILQPAPGLSGTCSFRAASSSASAAVASGILGLVLQAKYVLLILAIWYHATIP